MTEEKESEHIGHRKRLKQSYLNTGSLDGFCEHQILEMLLFYSIPRKDVNPLAHRLINNFGSLYGVLNADYNELIKFGLSENTAALIKLTMDIPKTAERNRLMSKTILSTNDAMDFCFSLMSSFRNEKICVICLNTASKLLHYKLISVGDPAKAYFSPRSIVEIAVSNGAAGIVLAHNHPSGNCLPSKADIESTLNLQRILMHLGIALQEHIIVAFPNCCAMLRGISKNMLNGEILSGSADECRRAVGAGSRLKNTFRDSLGDVGDKSFGNDCGENAAAENTNGEGSENA